MSVVFPVMVRVDKTGSGAQVVERDLEKIKQKALDANRAIRQVFGVFAIREVLTGLYGMVDSYTSLRNKINVVAKDQANLNGLMDETYKIAQQTRSSWASTATMYQRMALNSRQLGVSQRDLLDFTKSLNQAVIVGGATATEASAGLLQLSQGMASGALRGDELRAVLEQLPVVADVIAKKFNVTRGELRQLGTEGKISGRDIITAFKDSEKELQELFDKTIPTIGQGIEMVRNAATKFFGEAGAGSGVTEALGQAMKFLAENAETVGKVLLAVGQAVLGLLVIKTVTGLVRALFVVIAAHPLTAFVMIVTSLVLLLRQFGDALETGMGVMTKFGTAAITIGDHLRALWDQFKMLASVIYDFLNDAWNALTDAFSSGLDTTGIQFSLENALNLISAFVYAAVAILKRLGDIFKIIFGGIPIILAAKFREAFKGITDGMVSVINKVISVLNKLTAVHKIAGALEDIDDFRAARDAQNSALSQSVGIGKRVIDLQSIQNPTAGQLVEIDKLLAKQKELRAEYDKQGAIKKKYEDQYAPTNPIPKIDFDDDSLQGAKKLVTEDIKDILSGIDGDIQKWLAEKDDLAAKHAADRKKRDSEVGKKVYTDPSKFDAPGAGKHKGPDEWEALLRKLDSLLKKSNEVREAQMKLAEANALLDSGAKDKFGNYHTILEELQKRGITAGTVLSDYEKTLQAALFPMQAWVDKIREETNAMYGSTEEVERKNRVLEATHTLTEKGVTLTESEVRWIEKLVKAQQDRQRIWQIEQGMLDRITSSTRTYHDSLAALYSLMEQGKLTSAQASAEFTKITADFTASNDEAYNKFQEKWAKANPFAAGWLDAREKIQQDMLQVATAVTDVLTTAFGNLESFILDTVESGKVAWDSLIEGMIASLNRLALKILETWLQMKILGLAMGGGSAALQIGSQITAGGLGAGFDAESNGTADLGQQISDATKYLNTGADAGNFARGGSFTMNGTGGVDTNRVAMNLSNGERVDVTPIGSMSPIAQEVVSAINSGRTQNSGESTGPAKISVHNHIDRGELLSAVDSPEGERVILNVIRKNPGIVKSLLQR